MRQQRLNGMVLRKVQHYGKRGVGCFGNARTGDINCNQCAYLETALQQISGDYGCWETGVVANGTFMLQDGYEFTVF